MSMSIHLTNSDAYKFFKMDMMTKFKGCRKCKCELHMEWKITHEFHCDFYELSDCPNPLSKGHPLLHLYRIIQSKSGLGMCTDQYVGE